MNINREILMTIVKNSSNRLEGEQEILEINEQQLHLINKELNKLFSLHVVSQRSELLLAYEQSKCPETWWMSKNQAENEVNDFIANNCG